MTRKLLSDFDIARYHEDGFVNMPFGGAKLSDCNISKMEAWIADGAPE